MLFDDALLAMHMKIKAFPIGHGQTISSHLPWPSVRKLEIKPGDKVLEIGTGSGYQACVLL